MSKGQNISNIGAVQTLVQVLSKKNVADVVLSPGSRNAPFIISFTALEEFKCQSILDERSAGFVALGIAQQKRHPVVLCCTSGSAVLNYTPAMVEAYYQRIPLIAITADRPTSRVDQGEGQSIRQMGAMDEVTVKAVELVEEHREEDRWLNRRRTSEAVEWALRLGRPVQINVPLSEPLYGDAPLKEMEEPVLEVYKAEHAFNEQQLLNLRTTWKEAERIVILVTQGRQGEACLEELKHLSEDPRVAIVTETTSNLYHLGFVPCIDRTIDTFVESSEESEYVPDLLITIGENIISKKIKGFFRRNKEHIQHHWHFGEEVMDTFERLSLLLDGHPIHVLRELASVDKQSESRFGLRWRSRYFATEEPHKEYLAQIPWSDMKAFESIMDFIPDRSRLQMGNSSVVRYVQLFSPLRGIHYNGNRGVSGIEGCTSTAVGAAQASDQLTVLISGDQAFRYDSNALATKQGIEKLRIIVIQNGGGNIFRIIDGPGDHDMAEKFIERRDEQSIKGLVDYYGVDYLKADDQATLEEALAALFDPKQDGPAVLEVFTPREGSPVILKEYFTFLKSKLAKS